MQTHDTKSSARRVAVLRDFTLDGHAFKAGHVVDMAPAAVVDYLLARGDVDDAESAVDAAFTEATATRDALKETLEKLGTQWSSFKWFTDWLKHPRRASAPDPNVPEQFWPYRRAVERCNVKQVQFGPAAVRMALNQAPSRAPAAAAVSIAPVREREKFRQACEELDLLLAEDKKVTARIAELEAEAAKGADPRSAIDIAMNRTPAPLGLVGRLLEEYKQLRVRKDHMAPAIAWQREKIERIRRDYASSAASRPLMPQRAAIARKVLEAIRTIQSAREEELALDVAMRRLGYGRDAIPSACPVDVLEQLESCARECEELLGQSAPATSKAAA